MPNSQNNSEKNVIAHPWLSILFRSKYLKWSVIQITGKHRLFAMMIIYDLYSSNKIHQYSVVNIYRFIHFFTTEHHRDVYNGSWNPLER